MKSFVAAYMIVGMLSLSSAQTATAGQLFLVAGTGGDRPERFGAILSRVESDGTVRRVTELGSRANGLWWFGISYDLRRAVAERTGETGSDVLVLDLDRAAVVKKCREPETSNVSRLGQWLADAPGSGGAYDVLNGGGDPNSEYIERMDLDPQLPCDRSFVRMSQSGIRDIVAHGTAGVGDSLDMNPEGRYVILEQDGNVSLPSFGVPSFNLRVPAVLRNGFIPKFVTMLVNSRSATVLLIENDTRNLAKLLAFRKSDSTWHLVPVAGTEACRAFGRFLAIVDSQWRPNSPRLAHSRGTELPAVPESVGQSKLRKRQTALGPDLAESFKNSEYTFSGKLHLYDIDTGQLRTITTRQADSEILLVDGDLMYYRVGNQLFSAPLTSKGFGRPQLLATDETIGDTHWAFISGR